MTDWLEEYHARLVLWRFVRKPISWINDFRLGFVGNCVAYVGDAILNCIFILNPGFVSSNVFIGLAFPSELANDDWRFRTDFLVSSPDKAIGGVFFCFKVPRSPTLSTIFFLILYTVGTLRGGGFGPSGL